MSMTNAEARLAINNKIKAFTGIAQDRIQWSNQPNSVPPATGLWCRVTIQYGDSVQAGLHYGTLERDIGIISIQCFARKGTGDKDLIALADAWRSHFKGWNSGFLEVTQTNAPTEANHELETDFIASLVRVYFRVN